MGGGTLVSMNSTTTTNVSGFVPDASLVTLCTENLGDPEVGAESAGTLLLMGVSAPVNDGADAREAHHSASTKMYTVGIELANFPDPADQDQDEYRACVVLETVRRVVTVIATAVGRGVSCEQEVSDFLSIFSADTREELLHTLEELMAFADPKRIGF